MSSSYPLLPGSLSVLLWLYFPGSVEPSPQLPIFFPQASLPSSCPQFYDHLAPRRIPGPDTNSLSLSCSVFDSYECVKTSKVFLQLFVLICFSFLDNVGTWNRKTEEEGCSGCHPLALEKGYPVRARIQKEMGCKHKVPASGPPELICRAPPGGSWLGGSGPAWLSRPGVEEERIESYRELGWHGEKISIYKCMQMYANLCSSAASLGALWVGAWAPP